MTRRVCVSCFADYAPPGQALCGDCAAMRGQAQALKSLRGENPAKFQRAGESDFGVPDD